MSRCLRYVLTAFAVVLFTAQVFGVFAQTKTYAVSGAGEVDITVDYIAPSSNQADIEAGADGTRVYSVMLEWHSTGSIIYNAGNTNYVWNDTELKYDSTVENQGWTVNDAKIEMTVKNRSNRTVDVEFSQPKAIDGVTITGTYDKSTLNIPSAAPVIFTGIGKEQSDTAVYTVGTVTGNIAGTTKSIAAITVTIIGN